MLFLGAAIIVLWFLLMRPGLARMDAKMAARVLKLAGAAFAICAAIAVMLRGHFDLALLLGGGGLWLYSLANKTSAQAGGASRQSKVSRVRSAMIEMEFDSVTGVMRGLVLAGPDGGTATRSPELKRNAKGFMLCAGRPILKAPGYLKRISTAGLRVGVRQDKATLTRGGTGRGSRTGCPRMKLMKSSVFDEGRLATTWCARIAR